MGLNRLHSSGTGVASAQPVPHRFPISRNTTLPGDPTLPRIHTVRGRRIVLDNDLAALDGVATGQFNRAIKRNESRFPTDFGFRLTVAEWEDLRCQIGTLKTARGQHRKSIPLPL